MTPRMRIEVPPRSGHRIDYQVTRGGRSATCSCGWRATAADWAAIDRGYAAHMERTHRP